MTVWLFVMMKDDSLQFRPKANHFWHRFAITIRTCFRHDNQNYLANVTFFYHSVRHLFMRRFHDTVRFDLIQIYRIKMVLRNFFVREIADISTDINAIWMTRNEINLNYRCDILNLKFICFLSICVWIWRVFTVYLI